MQNHSALSEDELLHGLRKGDEATFTEIYNRYWKKLLTIGFYHTHDKQEAEDIVHEILISLWDRKAELHIHSLEAYLATAVRFAVFKAIARDKRRRVLLADGKKAEQWTNVEEQLEAKWMQEDFNRVIERLPGKARLVFQYSRNEELTIAEIAQKMDLSPKAVEYHMTKALRALRNKLLKIKSFFI